MHTYLLSDDVVRRYLLDLADRLAALNAAYPAIWVVLGRSGDKIATALGEILPTDVQGRLQIVRASFDRKNATVIFRDDFDWTAITDESVLLIDSAIHSGLSMNIAAKALFDHGIKNIVSYSLVVKRTSDFIPSYFGIMIDEHDRTFFQLDRYPNNRLQKKGPFGILRSLTQHDLDREPSTLACGVPSLDKISMADLMYGVRTQGAIAMLYEIAGEIAAFLSFYVDRHKILHIDVVATDIKFRGLGIGATLVRWAETYARSSRCIGIELWAIAERVDFYRNLGFSQISEEPWRLGRDETYYSMRRPILYNIKIGDLTRY